MLLRAPCNLCVKPLGSLGNKATPALLIALHCRPPVSLREYAAYGVHVADAPGQERNPAATDHTEPAGRALSPQMMIELREVACGKEPSRAVL